MSTESTNQIEEDASEWLIRRDSGQWTEADQARLGEWLNASTLHRIAYLRLELAWEESARLKALGAGIDADQPPAPGTWNLDPMLRPQRPSSSASTAVSGTRRHLGIAASILLTIAAAVSGYHYWTGTGDPYTTPIGGLASVPMADGSKITLNTNSFVRVALTESERRIDLKQGEAFFEVAKDPNRPFIVKAGSKRVIAVGTKFSVRRDGESVEVIVTEGKVRIEDPRTQPSALNTQHSVLVAGAIARANDAGVLIERKTLPEAETHLSWRIGVLMFRDQTLGDAAAEFNRYNVRKIVIADPAVAALKVEGNFRATNVEAFVRLLESGFPVQASLEEDRITLSSR